MPKKIQSFVKILDVYLDVNRRKIARRAKLSRTTVQNAFSSKGNLTIRTIPQIVHEAVA
jgi:DNA-binding phage protein